MNEYLISKEELSKFANEMQHCKNLPYGHVVEGFLKSKQPVEILAEGEVSTKEIGIVDRLIIDKKDVGNIVYDNVKKRIGKKVKIMLEVY